MPNSYGALPPRGEEWQDRKTAASIKFVKEAEKYIARCSVKDSETLKEAIERVKSGDLIFLHWITPKEFIRTEV